jgi:hypothetical protein
MPLGVHAPALISTPSTLSVNAWWIRKHMSPSLFV